MTEGDMKNFEHIDGVLGVPAKHSSTHAWLWLFLVMAVAAIMFILKREMVVLELRVFRATHFTNDVRFVEEPPVNDE